MAREAGIYEQSMIIVTSDHGEAFGEHGMLEHAHGSAYAVTTHIPLLVKYPKQRSAATVDAPVSRRPDAHGPHRAGSLERNSAGTGVARAACHIQSRIHREQCSGRLQRFLKYPMVTRAVLQGSMKFILDSRLKAELYDLDADPMETRILCSTHDGREAAKREVLAAWVATAPPVKVTQPVADPEEVRRLKALGYVQ